MADSKLLQNIGEVMDAASPGTAKSAAEKAVYQAGSQAIGHQSQIAFRTVTWGTGSLGKGMCAGAASASMGGASVVGGIAGEYAGQKIAEQTGVTGKTKQAVEEGSGFVGAAGAGAIVGAGLAGPPGAVVGLGIGVAGQAFSKGIGAVVDCCFKDDRSDFGMAIGKSCARCKEFCQNRGCKRCKKNYCAKCYTIHKKSFQ